MGKRTGKPRGRPKSPKAERKASLAADIDAEVQQPTDEEKRIYSTLSVIQAERELFAELNADEDFERAAAAWREERRNLCFGAKYLFADPPFDDERTVQIIIEAERISRAIQHPRFNEATMKKRFTALDLVVATRAKSQADGAGAPKNGEVKAEIKWRQEEQDFLKGLELPGSRRFLEGLRKKQAASK